MTARASAAVRYAVAVTVTMLVALAVGGRLDGALAGPDAIAGSARRSTVPVGTDLSQAPAPTTIGFPGPDRPYAADADPADADRLWFAEGRWWGVFEGATGAHHIWGSTGPEGPWVDTGVTVDDRSFASVTVAWTGTSLVVAGTGSRDYRSHGLRLSRFTWSPETRRWTRDTDFPVQVTDGGAPGTQMAVDSAGRIWLARLDGDRILVANGDVTNTVFTAFESLPTELAGSDVGGFTLIAGSAGPQLVWRSMTTDVLTVATHGAGSWKATEHAVYGIGGKGPLDAVAAGRPWPRELLVLATTSLAERGANDQDPSIVLLSVTDQRVTSSVVAVGTDQLVTPELSVDRESGEVHVISVIDPGDQFFAAVEAPAEVRAEAPIERGGDAAGGNVWTVTDKVAAPPDLAFGVGAGAPVLREPVGAFARPLVPSLTDPGSGLMVAASGPDVPSWYLNQSGGSAPSTQLPARPTAVTLLEATFDQRPLGQDAPRTWFVDGPAVSALVAPDPSGTGRALALTNPGAGEVGSLCRQVPSVEGRTVTVTAVVRSVGRGSGDARLLDLKGPNGTLASVRITRKGEAGYGGLDGRVTTVPVGDEAELRVVVRIAPSDATAELHVEGDNGAVPIDVRAPLLSALGAGPTEVCFRPPPGNPAARLLVSAVKITAT